MTYTNATTLVEFLRARFDEDEATALPFRYDSGDVDVWRCDEVGGTVRSVGEQPFGLTDAVAQGDVHAVAVHIAHHNPARVMAHIAAKRQIVELYEHALEIRRTHPDDLAVAGELLGLHAVMKILALPFAAHSDYNPSWRPAEVTA